MFNPAIASKNIKSEFIDYITTVFDFEDKQFKADFRNDLERTISQGPFLQLNHNFRAAESINDLIEQGILSPLFRELEVEKPESPLYRRVFPLDRPLYCHQVNAIKKILKGQNAVISTGTGSGKTNCFLIPVINELLREKENGTLDDGVRAIFIYPMNALANDQVKNIRTLLMKYSDITFGVYNGGTKYEEDSANLSYEELHSDDPVPELRKPLENERVSRDSLKKRPPHILFTNYSMLEYLLLRPKDDVLFRNSNFRFVVLDEAHVYTGATGIETSFLMRRLKARLSARKKPQFILTSATLGGEGSEEDIIAFAHNLSGESFLKECIIRSEREGLILPNERVFVPYEAFHDLANERNVVADVLRHYKIPFDANKDERAILYELLIRTVEFAWISEKIGKVTSIRELSDEMHLSEDAIIDIISLCSRAEQNGKCLLDAKYHFFLRALDGCYLSLSPSRTLSLIRRQSCTEKWKQYLVTEIAVCENCGKIAFVGIQDKKGIFRNADAVTDPEYYVPINDDWNSKLIVDDNEELKTDELDSVFYLCPHCGLMYPADEDLPSACECGSESFIKVVKARTSNKSAYCVDCSVGKYRRFYLGSDAATSVIATALFGELPEHKVNQQSDDYLLSLPESDDPFMVDDDPVRKKELMSSGQQFLVFSDSRQEAAKFACYLKNYYMEFLRRRGMYHVLHNFGNADWSVKDIVVELANFFSDNKMFAKKINDGSNLDLESRRQAWIAVLNEMSRYNSHTSLTALGFMQFYMKESNNLAHKLFTSHFNVNGVSEDSISNLLDLLAFQFIKAGAIQPDDTANLSDADREYIFYSAKQKNISLESVEGVSTHWLPKDIVVKDSVRSAHSSKIEYVKHVLGCNDSTAKDFLKGVFNFLSNSKRLVLYDKGFVLSTSAFGIRTPKSRDARWYKCRKCGHVSQFHLNHHCVLLKCDGEVDEINPDILNKENHYAHLYKSKQLNNLYIEEHTAQLGKENSLRFQEEFIKKEINALSCSTTFEMGVDVGDLETVFLRNVPPLPSNYAQRAGRAGRSKDASAYSITYAKRSSHDLTYFQDPAKMIIGTISPPLFKTENEKVFRRHIYAVSLSIFFAENEEMYNHNDAEVFLNQKGYEKFICWLNSKPSKLTELLHNSFSDNELYYTLDVENFGWLDGLIGPEGVLTTHVDYYNKVVEELKKQEKAASGNGVELSQIQRRMKLFMRNELVDFLARGNILPRYGFPVDTVELYQSYLSTNGDKELRLNRDLLMAIAEYAPSSEVVANGKLYTSRYIRPEKTDSHTANFHESFLAICAECGSMNSSQVVGTDGQECIVCGKPIPKAKFTKSIEPRAGFIAETEIKDVPMKQPEKNYKSDVFYLHNSEARSVEKHSYLCGDIVVCIESTVNDSLMVKSESIFYVCGKCGYAKESNENLSITGTGKKKRNTLKIEYPHRTPTGVECSSKTLEQKLLHHTFHTDVAKIEFECDTGNYDIMLSVMYAILFSISDVLNIERKDISACLTRKKGKQRDWQIIIYDAVPGGAGHSRRIVSNDGKVLSRIFNTAYRKVSDCDCDPSCYKCLRSYENQKVHDKLNRNMAKVFLERLQGDCIPLSDEEVSIAKE